VGRHLLLRERTRHEHLLVRLPEGRGGLQLGRLAPVLAGLEDNPRGCPAVPAAYALSLLAAPINACISSVEGLEQIDYYPEERIRRVRVKATVDAGEDDGLLPGMILHGRLAGVHWEAEVVATAPDSAAVEFRYWERSKVRPRPGWNLSTRRG